MGTFGTGLPPGSHGLLGYEVLVPGEDPAALAASLREWLTRSDLRARLRGLAADRRATLDGWDVAAARVEAVLAAVRHPAT